MLILGGTAEARELASRLVAMGQVSVTSLAGRVAEPALPQGRVVIGGFGGAEGLREWLVGHRCRAVIDATHPFAARISENAVRAAAAAQVPLLRLQRPEWVAGPGDRWVPVDGIAGAAAAVAARGGRVFLTTGRQDVGAFAPITHAWFLVRVVDPPEAQLPPQHLLLRSRGPYLLAGERTLLRQHRIDLLVTKNSGGEHTRPKLVAAAEEGIEVVMVRRPPPAGWPVQVATTDAALEWLTRIAP